MTTAIEITKLIAAGGNEWQGGDKHRVYFNDTQKVMDALGIEVGRKSKSSGRYSGVHYNGETLSNSRGNSLVARIEAAGLYYDVVGDKWASKTLTDDELARFIAAII